MTAAKTMAEALAEHAFHLITPVKLDDVNGPWQVECNCTADPIQGPSYLDAEAAFAAHQAAALSAAGFGLVADAKAEALEEAADALERVDRIAAKPVNRVTPEEEAEYMEFANSGGDKNWLRARAAALRGDS
jgi:hypothetical protein